MPVVPKMPSNLITHLHACKLLSLWSTPSTYLVQDCSNIGYVQKVTLITGFSNFVNAQVCHFHLSGLQEIITYISVSNTPVNGSLGAQLQPLTLFRNILTLDESKQVTFITATVRKLYVPCLETALCGQLQPLTLFQIILKARSHSALRLDHGQNPSKSCVP